MDKLAGFLERRRWLVLAAWLLILLAALPFAARQTEHLTSGGFEVPGSQSQVVSENITRFEGAQRDNLAVVLARRPGATEADVRAEVDRVERIADRLPHAVVAPRAVAAAKRDAATASITVVPITLDGDRDQTADLAVDFRDELGTEARGGIEPHLVGQQALWAGMQDLTKEDLESAEKIGFPIVLLILLAVFGSLAAAALPLALGFASVTITGAVIFYLSQATAMSVFVTNIASMIGIGVAVDYSLFVLARYREEIRGGAERDEARRIALRTSGLAVTFSGITVMLSLAGLYLVDSTTIRSMAMGAIIVVAVSILAAVTLLPVLMSVLGRRAYARGRLAVIATLLVRMARTRRRRPGSTADANRRTGFWERWTAGVTRRPWVAVLAASGVLLALAIPALSLDFGNGALRQFPPDHETRVGAELAAQKAGPGATGPTQVIAQFRDGRATEGAEPRGAQHLRERAAARSRDRPGLEAAALARRTRGTRHRCAPPRSREPERGGAREAPARRPWRPRRSGGARGGRGDRVQLGLHRADLRLDVEDPVFRPRVQLHRAVPAPALGAAAAEGGRDEPPVRGCRVRSARDGVPIRLVRQPAWLRLAWLHECHDVPFLLAIVFGLSMDYEVFLLSRIRERYDATGDTKASVAQGLRASAGTISSAALIMVAVFAVFAGTGTPSIKEIGVGMSVAIALDATLVRLILVPATMEIMGRWNWWLPPRLDRVLPHAGFESGRRSAEPALDLGR